MNVRLWPRNRCLLAWANSTFQSLQGFVNCCLEIASQVLLSHYDEVKARAPHFHPKIRPWQNLSETESWNLSESCVKWSDSFTITTSTTIINFISIKSKLRAQSNSRPLVVCQLLLHVVFNVAHHRLQSQDVLQDRYLNVRNATFRFELKKQSVSATKEPLACPCGCWPPHHKIVELEGLEATCWHSSICWKACKGSQQYTSKPARESMSKYELNWKWHMTHLIFVALDVTVEQVCVQP